MENIILNEKFGVWLKGAFAGFDDAILDAIKLDVRRAVNEAIQTSASKTFSWTALRKTSGYQDALVKATAEGSRKMYGKTYTQLTNAEKKSLSQKISTQLEKEVNSIVKSEASSTGKIIKANKEALKQAKKAPVQNPTLINTLKQELKANAKAQKAYNKAVADFKKLKPQSFNKLNQLIEQGTKKTVTTGPSLWTRIKSPFVNIFSKGQVKQAPKEWFKNYPGKIVHYIVTTKLLRILASYGLLSAGLIWLFTKYGKEDDDVVVTNPEGEDLNDIDVPTWPTCVTQLVRSGELQPVEGPNEEIYVFGKFDEYPNGLEFYINGSVIDSSNNNIGTYECKTIAEQNISINESIERFKEILAYKGVVLNEQDLTFNQSMEQEDATTVNDKIGLQNIIIRFPEEDTEDIDVTEPEQVEPQLIEPIVMDPDNTEPEQVSPEDSGAFDPDNLNDEDKRVLYNLLASRNLRKVNRLGRLIYKWVGPELRGKEFEILNKYVTEYLGFEPSPIQKEKGDDMLYKWVKKRNP